MLKGQLRGKRKGKLKDVDGYDVKLSNLREP